MSRVLRGYTVGYVNCLMGFDACCTPTGGGAVARGKRQRTVIVRVCACVEDIGNQIAEDHDVHTMHPTCTG